MFEGLVRQLILGYLGRYVKDIQREQLKITLWNEEVLLENVELILAAFDYLRLPFALKEGRVGRLSIRIPWKKLGWDPIIIILEDVFVCASPRDDQEWSLAAVEQREFASKKAKLAAAELAKLSRRVCENQAGNSFISYITAKILDSIQVSIRNFHVVYHDLHPGQPSNSAQNMLGLKFSSLTIMKQTSASSWGLVNKMVVITGLEIYCSSSRGALSLVTRDKIEDSKDLSNNTYEGNAYDRILAPLDVSISLSVDRSGKLHTDAPQCSIDAEVANLVLSLDEVQLQHILITWDNLCTYQLREKYGRYRPWSSPLSRKPANWQKLWWQYAQESVLSDVRKILRRTSWRYFGERLIYRRQYVNLYKKKLIFLREEQSVDEDILLKLEEMEKYSDVDDILSYRAVAEREMEELLVNSFDSNSGLHSIENSLNLDQSSSRTRGWLNWLSRGMLGAGGTEDSGQFSGVVSDEVIKDIYEATEFQPPSSTNVAVPTNDDKLYRFAVKFCIREISALLRSTKSKTDTAKLILSGVNIEYKVCEESSSIVALLNSINMISPHDEKTLLLSNRGTSHSSCRIHIDLSPSQEVQVSLMIAVEPLKVSFDAAFLTNCMEFYNVLESVEFQHERVISSLNGIRDTQSRVQSKTEYILSTRGGVALDVRLKDVVISMPWTNSTLERTEMVLGIQALSISSSCEHDDWSGMGKDILMSVSEGNSSSQLHNMYDHFKVKINDAEVNIITRNNSKPVPIMEKFSALIGVSSCFVQDTSIPNQLEVYVMVPTLYAYFSTSICIAAMELISYLDDTHQKIVSPRSLAVDYAVSDHVKSSIFGLSLAATLGTVTVHVDLENEEHNSTSCVLSLNATDIRVESTELLNCWVFTKGMEIISYRHSDELDSRTLCLLGSVSDNTHQPGTSSRIDSKAKKNNDKRTPPDGCFVLHYEACRNKASGPEICTISLSDGDLHCYPHIIGLLIGFADRVAENARLHVDKVSCHTSDEKAPREMPDFENKRFGLSNNSEAESSSGASAPASHFPFITTRNSGDLGGLDDSISYCLSDWKKSFPMRNGKSGDVKVTKRNESNGYLSSSLKPATSGCDHFVVELNICRIRFHFHDSSCTIGIVNVLSTSSTVCIYEEFVDIVCSTRGLLLKSSCWRQGLLELLWGPASKDFCPILDVHVRIPLTLLNPQLEVSIDIQHVCCILPTEYLALLIGYFSLPDWTSDRKEHLDQHTDDVSPVKYKIEVLDSDLIIPTEKESFQFLSLEIPQMCCSIILDSPSVVAEDDPPNDLLDGRKLAEGSLAFNIFGRQLQLSLMLLKDEAGPLKLDQVAENRKLSLIAPLSADVWVRVAKESGSPTDSSGTLSCIMARIANCELVADEAYLFDGLDGLVTVIDKFSAIEDRSRDFVGNALQFLQAKSDLERDFTASTDVSSSALMDISLSVDSLMIKLHQTRQDSVPSEPVATVEMQFTCSISMRDEMPQHLEMSFSSFALYSLPSSATLARCSPAGCDPVLGITLSVSEQVRNDVYFSLPSLQIWLEFSDWVNFLGTIRSLAEAQGRSSYSGKSSGGPTYSVLNKVAASESNVLLTSSDDNSPGTVKHETTFLTLRTDNLGFTCHFPFPFSRDPFHNAGNALLPPSENQHLSHCKFATVAIDIRSALLSLNSRSSKFKSSIEKISACVGISPDESFRSPFFQIFQATLEAEIWNKTADLVDISAEVGCDHIEVGLSHQVFYFWHDIELNFPEAGRSQISIGCIDCKLNIRKVSLLLTDGRWTCNGPLLEVLIRNFVLHAEANETVVESAITSDLQVNYNNIHKVMWEPLIEPWDFHIKLTRKREISVLLKSSIVTDIHLKSMAQLHLNITESFFECICRTIEMISDALGLIRSNVLPESSSFLNPQLSGTLSAGRYAPYVLQNLTSLPLAYHTFLGSINSRDLVSKETKHWHYVQPGSSVPIYIAETPEEQVLRFRPAASSDRLNENQLGGTAHHFIVIQLEGTSMPSMPLSMDLVGVSYFLVDFSKTSSRLEVKTAASNSRLAEEPENERMLGAGDGFVIPVVFDVSVQRFSKLIQLYSTVIVENETSVPLELRFDIPLGLSPKILDPIQPGQKFPLPLHLAESGRVRWRPQGNSYVWSETHILQNILSQDSKIGFRSFVCYPSHPSSNRFCCCISVKKISMHLLEKRRDLIHAKNTLKQSPGERDGLLLASDKLRSRFIYQLTLITPLVVHNYLPEVVSFTIETGGGNISALLSEVETSFYHIDPSHELGLSFHLPGYKISASRFPDSEAFSTLAKSTGTKCILSEIVTFDTDVDKGSINVTLEKKMDPFSGARELFIFVPFLLYNCVGFPLSLADSASEVAAETVCTIPSCYDLVEQEPIQMKMEGLGLLSSNQHSSLTTKNDSHNSSMISTRRLVNTPIVGVDSSTLHLHRKDYMANTGESFSTSSNRTCPMKLSDFKNSSFVDNERGKVGAFAYVPKFNSSTSDNMVRLRRGFPEFVGGKQSGFSWSDPFPLDPASGSATVLVPQQIQDAAYVVSVTSTALSEPFAGRTRAISFQPRTSMPQKPVDPGKFRPVPEAHVVVSSMLRYVISNACSKELCYKQKGTNFVFHLGVGQHSHLHWMDTTRDLLVSIRYNEPGFHWSGSFLPDILADTQVKMRNYISGALNMIRVEVQNADVSIRDEKIVASIHGNSGTNLILLSDDDSGYMPYRIENFSKERLRIYQLKCENFETIVNSYQCCPYAWDEPCLPHRLVLEVPGERVLGSYALDDVQHTMTVHLPATLEKPERTLLISARTEGAMKVLSIIDSSYHLKDSDNNLTHEKRKTQQKLENSHYNEKVSITLPYIGVSLINSDSQELLFVCVKGMIANLLQSMDQQKLSFQVSSLQIDNQLHSTQYPVILSFDHESKTNSYGLEDGDQNKCENLHFHSHSSCESVICLAISKWRKKDVPVISFEYIMFRVAEFRLELEQEVVSSVADLSRTVYLRLQSGLLPFSDSTEPLVLYDISLLEDPHPLVCNLNTSIPSKNMRNHSLLPSVVPIGAPWQQIYHLARRQKKIYVEMFDLASVKFTLSFSSAPWMLRFGISTSGDSIMQRGLMALADIEGARIHLRELTISNHMASWESIQEILIRHYTRQLLHEMYKVLGSAGVIGNPIGFLRSLGLGIKDFLSVPTRNVLQSPVGLVRDMAQGTTSLLSNTVYALSDAAFQFSKAAQKGIVALTFDDQAVARLERQQRGVASHSQGIINEVLEGLTGLLQSPIRGAEKHGLPGVLSGMALGLTGVVARPAASILEVTGKTAQSIRNRSKHYQSRGAKRLRVRLPRRLRPDLPLKPYSWEEAFGTSVLLEVAANCSNDKGDDNSITATRLGNQDEVLVACKALRQAGKFVVLLERRILTVSCPSLVDYGSPHFPGISAEPEWTIESEIGLDSVIHCDADENAVHIVGSSSSDRLLRQGQSHHTSKGKEKWSNFRPATPPFSLMDLELGSGEEARQLLLIIEQGKQQRWGRGRVLHRMNFR